MEAEMVQNTSLILTLGLLICLTLLLSLGVILGRLVRQSGNPGLRRESFNTKCVPLEELKPSDISFLSEHPGLARIFVHELRRERRKVLREYLRSLRCDFSRTCADTRAAMVQSREDRPDLAHALLRQQVLFRLALLRAECSMLMEAVGLSIVDFDGIVSALGTITIKVNELFVTAAYQAH